MARTRLRGPATVAAKVPFEGGALQLPNRGNDWFVSGFSGSTLNPARFRVGNDSNDGKSWDRPFLTMAKALSVAQTNDRIFFAGKIAEEIDISTITDLNLKFDISIIGCGSKHHADQPGSGSSLYDPGAAVWQPPASPTAATALLNVYGRGWKFYDIVFDCPVDAAAVILNRNALSGTSEYDASHAQFHGCRFTSGLVGIQNAGGASFVTVKNCEFLILSGSGAAGIKCTSTSVAVPLSWRILDNHFFNNASHILSSMSYSTIKGNMFGRFTATLSIDIDDQPSPNQGEYNIITENYLSGSYGVTAYPAGSNNEWAGNQNVAGVTSADPT